MRRVVFLLLALLALPLLTACDPVVAETPTVLPSPTAGPVRDYLDYGIYWFGLDNASAKAQPGIPNPYFDPEKPTVLLIHGWQPNKLGERPTFRYSHTAEDGTTFEADLADAWVQGGWNVGMFYWDRLADEDIVIDAEDKIWSAQGRQGMRWRLVNGQYEATAVPNADVGELLFQAYRSAMHSYNGRYVRIAGHSLGNQLAVRLAHRIVEEVAAGRLDAQLLPQRLTLLDPYWSPIRRDYLGTQTTAERVDDIITNELLPRGTVVEWYRASSLTNGLLVSDANETLQDKVAFVELRPWFCSGVDQVCKHDAAWQLYFLSYAYPAPPECVRPEPGDETRVCDATGLPAGLASTPDARIGEMMGADFSWLQVLGPDGFDGRYTQRTDDDWFERLPRP